MASGLGKVSFSFSKITKKTTLQVQPTEKIQKIEYIDSIEDSTVQVLNPDASDEKGPLIIPLQNPNLLIQSVIDTVKSREKDKTKKVDVDVTSNGDSLALNDENKKETLDDIAAREILEEATKQVNSKSEVKTFVVPLAQESTELKESTLEDYDNIPVNDFGLAMLRGMGWDPKKGIGKNGKVVKVTGPTLRPKGLGLGADKSIAVQKPVSKNVSDKAVLCKGSRVRITFGPHKNLYGTVEGFDDDFGRVNVVMAISSERISINETFIQLVSPDEFIKFGKVININAFNNYKDKEAGKTESSLTQNNDSISSLKTDDKLENKSHSSKNYKSNNSESDSDDSYKKNHHKNYSSKSQNSVRYDSADKYNQSKSKYDKKYKSKHDRDYYDKHRSKSYYSSEDHNRSKAKSNHSKYSSDSESDSDFDDKRNRSKSKRSGYIEQTKSNRSRKYAANSSSDSDFDRKKHKNKKKKDRSRNRR